MSPGIRAFSALILVLLVGCSGPIGGANQPPLSVTPAEVPEDNSDLRNPNLSEKFSTGGQFTDPLAIATGHQSILANTSYTVIATQEIRFEDADQNGQWQSTGRFDDDGRYVVETERSGSVFSAESPIQIVFWSDGQRVIEAFIGNESITANVVLDVRGNPVPPRTVLPFDPYFEEELTTVLFSTNIASVSRLQNENSSYDQVRILATGPVGRTAAVSLDGATVVTNLTARLVIDERGFVKRYDLRYTGTFAGKPVTVRKAVRYQRLDDTVVEKPRWVPLALNNTSTSDYNDSSGSNASS